MKKTGMEGKDLAYWIKAVETNVTFGDILPRIPQEDKERIEKEEKYLQEAGLGFYGFERTDEAVPGQFLLEFTGNGSSDEKIKFAISFSIENFRIMIDPVIEKWVDDEDFRMSSMKLMGLKKEEEMKNVFAEKTEDGLTELENSYLEKALWELAKKKTKLMEDEEFIRRIAKAYIEEIVDRVKKDGDFEGVDLKPFDFL